MVKGPRTTYIEKVQAELVKAVL